MLQVKQTQPLFFQGLFYFVDLGNRLLLFTGFLLVGLMIAIFTFPDTTFAETSVFDDPVVVLGDQIGTTIQVNLQDGISTSDKIKP